MYSAEATVASGNTATRRRDQVAFLRFAGAQHAIDALADEIDEAVALAHEQLDSPGIRRRSAAGAAR